MKTAQLIIRILFGAILLFGSIPYFLNLFPEPELTGNFKLFNEGINAAIYLMPLVKTFELICGIALILNRFTLLATVLIFPISVNILCVNLFLAPQEGLILGLFIILANLFLIYQHKEYFKPLFVPRAR